MSSSKFFSALIAGGLALAATPSSAEEMSAQQIINGLHKTPSRSLSGDSRATLSNEDKAFVGRLRQQSRSLSAADRDHVEELAANRPKIDLDINFDYNSAAVTSKAEPQLNNLGKALTSSEIAGGVFVLGGHTDSKGSDIYNQSLSKRRAEAVKRYLVERYHIAPTNLVTAGYGKKGPKNANDLFAAENRRVEIVNMEEREQASK